MYIHIHIFTDIYIYISISIYIYISISLNLHLHIYIAFLFGHPPSRPGLRVVPTIRHRRSRRNGGGRRGFGTPPSALASAVCVSATIGNSWPVVEIQVFWKDGVEMRKDGFGFFEEMVGR